MSCAPFVQTPVEVAKKMIQLAALKPGHTLYDLGAGDGRLVIMAAQETGAHTVGVEMREDLVERARSEIKKLNLEERVQMVHEDFFSVDLKDADAVTLYLTTSGNERLRPKLEQELKKGAKVISHDFKVGNWKPSVVYNELLGHTIYSYDVGQQL
ncbi:class I SAM-dependent methyltransferase [Candidatus Bathyarchaeota archaeon]|jgi:tRNA A58 N-methylase Trm61|nr:class I SAM-dependent methyltransferase [Candidatus Bathyarchaeota archaeon]